MENLFDIMKEQREYKKSVSDIHSKGKSFIKEAKKDIKETLKLPPGGFKTDEDKKVFQTKLENLKKAFDLEVVPLN